MNLLVLLACAPEPPPVARPNVLIVSMDTVRWDRTSLAGGRDTTPNLAALGARGVVFTNAFAVGNESLYSHAAIFTGRYPSEVAAPDYATYALPPGTPTLARALSAYGYATGAFTGGGHLLASFGFGEGFDTFEAAPGDDGFGSFYESVPRALAWIRARPAGEPWFAFVHGYDAHSPYVQPGPFRHLYGSTGATPVLEYLVASPTEIERVRGTSWFPDRTLTDFVHAAGRTVLGTDFYDLPAAPRPGERAVPLSPAELAHLRDHYDTGLTYGDTWLGVLLAEVDLSRTLVIVLSDHGEDLLDHGNVNHRSGLWDSTLHVPLVVAGPGIPRGERRDVLVDLRDVVPTVITAVGATLPSGAYGTPLQTTRGYPAVYAEGVMDSVSVRTPEARLTVRAAGVGRPDSLAGRGAGDGTATLHGVPDSGPKTLVGGAAREADALMARLATWRREIVPGPPAFPSVPAATREALRARGYWEPTTTPTPTAPAPAPAPRPSTPEGGLPSR